ncbi:hypothetical protein PR048_022815 [Dryococelus australis]|uniref:Uncharacterized protein n=1 Tax=Dryococelus australis TaxID=614101 RepID=A0ABQ9GSC2_9NEOP|nr:hypothetical protein PR048_022815 [Dryococelus australis]
MEGAPLECPWGTDKEMVKTERRLCLWQTNSVSKRTVAEPLIQHLPALQWRTAAGVGGKVYNSTLAYKGNIDTDWQRRASSELLDLHPYMALRRIHPSIHPSRTEKAETFISRMKKHTERRDAAGLGGRNRRVGGGGEAEAKWSCGEERPGDRLVGERRGSVHQLPLNIEVLRTDESKTRRVRSSGEMQGSGKREILEKTRLAATSSGTIPACQNSGATPPGIEPGTTRWDHKCLPNTFWGHGGWAISRLACSPPTKTDRVQSPVGSPDFRKWESCWTMTLVGGFSRESPVSPALSFRSIFTSITLIGSQDLAVKSRPNIFT